MHSTRVVTSRRSSLPRRTSIISGEMSDAVTGTPARASGRASRPVPAATSSSGRPAARCTSRSTAVGSGSSKRS
jgi:hypothetical protein